MPELPEVETIKRQLQNAVIGKQIRALTVYNDKVIRQPRAEVFKDQLRGALLKRIDRRGKFLVIELSTGKFLTVHLRMTGQLIYPARERSKETRLTFHFSDGENLDFRDRRLFGELRLVDDWRSLKFVQNLGPEPQEISPSRFREMLKGRKTAIKPLLMDQTFVAGIGNLYAAEILFRSRIHPARPAVSLTAQEIGRLVKEMNNTLQEAVTLKGSSVDQYMQLSGEPGGYAQHHRVYGRRAEPCPVCKTPIQRIRVGGRGTYLCPQCQH